MRDSWPSEGKAPSAKGREGVGAGEQQVTAWLSSRERAAWVQHWDQHWDLCSSLHPDLFWEQEAQHCGSRDRDVSAPMGWLGVTRAGPTTAATGACTFVWASWSAPCLTRMSATFTLSSWAARCKAVSPLCRGDSGEGTLVACTIPS